MGREALRIDAVDRQGDVVGADAVVFDQILLDIAADGQRLAAPVGDEAPVGRDLEHAVRAGDKAEMHPGRQNAAQERRYARVRVDDIELLLRNQAPQAVQRPDHRADAFGVERQADVPDAAALQLLYVHAPAGYHRDRVSAADQLARKLDDVGFRAADVKRHGRHENFHAGFPFGF